MPKQVKQAFAMLTCTCPACLGYDDALTEAIRYAHDDPSDEARKAWGDLVTSAAVYREKHSPRRGVND